MRTLPIAAVLIAALISAGTASAAKVTGTIKGGKGLQVVLLQASGKGAKTTITKANGSFSVSAASLQGASLQIVDDEGSYVGPIVLGGKGTKVYATIKGSAALALGAVTLKNGYAVAKAPVGRYQTTAAYTAAAKGAMPIGALATA